MPELALYIALAILGHAVHLLKKVVEARQNGDDITLPEYVRNRPYATVLGMCGSAAAMAVLWEYGQLTVVSALGVGYIADSGLAILQRSTERRV